MNIEEFKQTFEKEFSLCLEEKVREIQRLSVHTRTEELFTYVETLAQNGKRFRPYLIQTAYTVLGGTKSITPYLNAIELLHLFALIHDDIMDQSLKRHAVATAHKKFEEFYPDIFSDDKKRLLAESQALLLGDLVFEWSQECLRDETHTNAKKQYHTLIKEVIVGQSMDVDFSGISHVSEELVLQKASLKSGNYSIMHPLLIGAHLANASQENLAWVEKFGFTLGLLFQIQDDLLDCMKTTEQIGKTAFNDIRTKQQTLVSWFMLQNTEKKHRDAFSAYYGKETLSTEDELTLQRLLVESGAIDYSLTKIQSLERELEELIQNSAFNTENKQVWTALLHTVSKRSH